MSVIFMIKGKPGSGKDESATYLTERYGFTRYAFGDFIRQGVYALDPIVQFGSVESTFSVKQVVDKHGWDYAKRNFPEVRRLLQKFGTEAGRDLHGENCWAQLLREKMYQDTKGESKGLFVIPDFRYLNEYRQLNSFNDVVKIIKIVGRGEESDHLSEAFQCNEEDFLIEKSGKQVSSLTNPISVIDNSKSLEVLHFQLDQVVMSVFAKLTSRVARL